MDNYLGELRIMAFGMIPRNWAPCNGQSLNINNNRDLFSLLGTTYGGDGIATFNLPDLRGRASVHFGLSSYLPNTDFRRGEAAGSETVTLAANHLPAHSHSFRLVHTKGTGQLSPEATRLNYLAAKPQVPQTPNEDIQSFAPNIAAGQTRLHPDSIAQAGEGQPHQNRMPFLPMLICIALTGRFPREN